MSKKFPSPTLPDVAKVTTQATNTATATNVTAKSGQPGPEDLDRNGRITIRDGKGRHGQHGKGLVIHGFNHGRPQWRELAESRFAGIPSDKQPTKSELKDAFARAIYEGTPERAHRLRRLQSRLAFFDARKALHTTDQSSCAHFPNVSLSRQDPGLVRGQVHSRPFDETDAILAVLDVMLDTGRGRGQSMSKPDRKDEELADYEKLPLTAKIDAAISPDQALLKALPKV